jgi:hypothetical protein
MYEAYCDIFLWRISWLIYRTITPNIANNKGAEILSIFIHVLMLFDLRMEFLTMLNFLFF